jgi:Flp pilus assembly protein TadD
MRAIYDNPTEAAAVGARARKDVLVSCAPERVVEAVRHRLEAADRHPTHLSRTDVGVANETPRKPRRRKRERGITACVVVRDSGAFVAQCLASVQAVADSAVVVDVDDPPDDIDMAKARNEALDRASGDWVLMLDATHTLDPASREIVRELVDGGPFVGYSAPEVRQVGLDGATSGIGEWRAVLFPRHPGLRYVGRVSEQLLPRRPDVGFRIEPSLIVLRQHDPRQGRDDPAARARRELPLLELSVREEPDEPFHLYNLGAALEHLGLHKEAEATLRRALKRAPKRVAWAAPAFGELSRALAARGQTERAVRVAERATRRAPDWARGWCRLGEALADAGRLDEAVAAYSVALERSAATWVQGSGPDDVEWQVRAGMGKIHLARDEYREAADWLRTAAALHPTNAELRVRLAEAYERLGFVADARVELEGAMAASGTGPDAYVAFSDFFARRAEDALLRGLADHPENRALLDRVERLRAAKVTG